MSSSPARTYSIDVLGKCFAILEAMADRRAVRITDVVLATGLPKTTVFRLLQSLVELGYVQRTGDGGYGLGLRFLRFDAAFYSRNELRHAAAGPMQQLLARYGDTVNLAVFDGHQLVYLEILEGTYSFHMGARVGAQVPLHATALGKAVAALLPDTETRGIVGGAGLTQFTGKTVGSLEELQQQLAVVRSEGYSLDDQENEQGMRCIASAILDRQGRPVGAISLSGPTHRLTDATLASTAQDVRGAAQEVTRWLGAWTVT